MAIFEVDAMQQVRQHNLSETNDEAGYEQIVAMGCRHSNSFTTSGADLQISE